METSKKTQQPQTIQQPQIGKLPSVPSAQSLGISALRIEDIMMAIRFAERTQATEILKQSQMNLVALKENLDEQINSLNNIKDKL